MTLQVPLWEQNDSYSATRDRALIDAVFASGGGVVGLTDLLVTQRGAGANMSVDVAAGKCVVPGTDVSGQGKYLCASDAVANVVITTAPGTGNSRIDLIVATVRDSDAIGGSNNDWIIHAVAGTAASSPVAPSIPASSIQLSQVLVGANVTSINTGNCTDARDFALSSQVVPTCRAYRGASFGSNSSFNILPIDTIADDNNEGFNTSSHVYTVQVPGRYAVNGSFQIAASAAGQNFQVYIYKNGSLFTAGNFPVAVAANTLVANVSDLVPVVKGDTIAIWYYSSNATLVVAAGSPYTFMSLARIGA